MSERKFVVDSIEIEGTLTANNAEGALGQVLKSTVIGIEWAGISIDELTDVSASPSDGDFLKYVSASSSWISASIPTGGEVTTTTISTNSETTIATFTTTSAKSAEFHVKVGQGDRLYSSKILALQNGTTVDFTKYGELALAATEIVEEAGSVWTTRTSNFGNSNVNSVVYGNNLWVAGGYNGQIRTSTDAITWVTRTSPNSVRINVIAYADGKFVAGQNYSQQVGAENILVSTDAITWVSRNTTLMGMMANPDINGLAYGTLWVGATGTGDITVSTDTITWTSRVAGSYIELNDIVYGLSKYVTVGQYGVVLTSTDSITWTTRTSNFGNTKINSVSYGNNLFVAVGQFGQLRTSTDAITWVTRTSNFGNTHVRSIEFGNNMWVAGGYYGQLRTSTDAITWVTRTSTFGNSTIRGAAYGNNLWVASGYYGQISTSAATTAQYHVGGSTTSASVTFATDISGSDVRLRMTIPDAATTSATAKVVTTTVGES